ncbi:MAG: hypothetical protein IIC13_13695, partial [SAR324 cluster bacterium]|nr:hypothetical protein [SAR324 cluster bacterium]
MPPAKPSPPPSDRDTAREGYYGRFGGRFVPETLIAPLEEEIRSLLGDHVFATGEQTMQDILGELLRSKDLTVASYEGLTGGLVAQQLQESDGLRFLQGTIGQQESTLRAVL